MSTRRPVPTGSNFFSPTVNGWLLQWANERTELEAAERALDNQLAESERLRDVIRQERAAADAARAMFLDAQKELERLRAELNTPEVNDFARGVVLEAAHQRERWGTEHDGGKTDADWFWLVGYLVGKALHKPEKRLHHLITAAAALANWHLYTLGKTNMRPGIAPPPGADGGA